MPAYEAYWKWPAAALAAALLWLAWRLLLPAVKRIHTRSGVLALGVTAVVAWPIAYLLSAVAAWMLAAVILGEKYAREHPALPLEPAFYVPWLTLVGVATVVCGSLLIWAAVHYASAAKQWSVPSILVMVADVLVVGLLVRWVVMID